MMNYRENLRFCRCYPHVLNVEGGYLSPERAARIGDSGGATNYGIAFNHNQGYLKRFDIVKPEQIKYLSREQALEIYFKKYWLPSQADEIPDIRLALAYFDMVINAGNGAADKLLGKLPGNFWYFEGDGKNPNYFWGVTLQYMLHRLMFYVDLRNWNTFGAGWFNRLIKISQALGKV